MSRKNRLFILILISILLCVSCKQESPTKEPTYNIFQTPESTDVSSIIADIPSTPFGSTITESDTTNSQAVANINNNDSQPTNSSSLPKEEEPWPYPLEFKGITPTGKYKAGNLGMNCIYVKYLYTNLICPDSDNSILYYVNIGIDNYIYKLENGIRSLLVEKDSFSLNLWDNKLYFISKNGSQSVFSCGDIYYYDLDTEELVLVNKADASYLLVDTLGIYYQEVANNNFYEQNYYRLNFNDNNLTSLDHRYILSYYEYQLIVNENGVVLQHSETKKEIFIAPIDYSDGLTIYNDHVIFNRDGVFYSLNLLNGDKKAIRWGAKNRTVFPVDYIIVDDIIYLAYGIKIDLANELVNSYSIRSYYDTDKFIPQTIFTDGSKIYAAVSIPYLGNQIKLVELVYDENEFLVNKKELGE